MNTIKVVRKTIVEDTRAVVTPLHVLTSVDMCVYNTEHTDKELSVSQVTIPSKTIYSSRVFRSSK